MCGELIYADLLAQLWIESVLYGLYLLLFACCVYIHLYRRPSKRGLIIDIAMCIVASGEVITDVVNILITPELVSNSRLVSTSLFACEECEERTRQGNLYTWINNVSVIFFITKLALGDSVLVHRCWIIWHAKPWVPAIPAFLLFCTTAIGYAQVAMQYRSYYVQRTSTGSAQDVAEIVKIEHLLYDLSTASTATCVATNILVTGLVVFKIWRDLAHISHFTGIQSSKLYSTAIMMVIESGGLYTASLLAELISNNFSGPAAYVANDMSDAFTAMLVVIAPSLIIIRVGLGIGYAETSNRGPSTTAVGEGRKATVSTFPVFASAKTQDEETGATSETIGMFDLGDSEPGSSSKRNVSES